MPCFAVQFLGVSPQLSLNLDMESLLLLLLVQVSFFPIFSLFSPFFLFESDLDDKVRLKLLGKCTRRASQRSTSKRAQEKLNLFLLLPLIYNFSDTS